MMKYLNKISTFYNKAFTSGLPKYNTYGIITKLIIVCILYLLIFFMIYGPIFSSISDDEEKYDMKWITLSLFLTSVVVFYISETFLRLNDL